MNEQLVVKIARQHNLYQAAYRAAYVLALGTGAVGFHLDKGIGASYEESLMITVILSSLCITVMLFAATFKVKATAHRAASPVEYAEYVRWSQG